MRKPYLRPISLFLALCLLAEQPVWQVPQFLSPRAGLPQGADPVIEAIQSKTGYQALLFETNHLAEVWADVWEIERLAFEGKGYTSEELRKSFEDPKNRVFLLKETISGRIVGYALVGPDHRGEKDAGYAYSAAIHPAYQGKKLVGKLMDEVEAALINEGYIFLTMDASVENGYAGAIQRHYGARIEETYEHDNPFGYGRQRYFKIRLEPRDQDPSLDMLHPDSLAQYFPVGRDFDYKGQQFRVVENGEEGVVARAKETGEILHLHRNEGDPLKELEYFKTLSRISFLNSEGVGLLPDVLNIPPLFISGERAVTTPIHQVGVFVPIQLMTESGQSLENEDISGLLYDPQTGEKKRIIGVHRASYHPASRIEIESESGERGLIGLNDLKGYLFIREEPAKGGWGAINIPLEIAKIKTRLALGESGTLLGYLSDLEAAYYISQVDAQDRVLFLKQEIQPPGESALPRRGLIPYRVKEIRSHVEKTAKETRISFTADLVPLSGYGKPHQLTINRHTLDSMIFSGKIDDENLFSQLKEEYPIEQRLVLVDAVIEWEKLEFSKLIQSRMAQMTEDLPAVIKEILAPQKDLLNSLVHKRGSWGNAEYELMDVSITDQKEIVLEVEVTWKFPSDVIEVHRDRVRTTMDPFYLERIIRETEPEGSDRVREWLGALNSGTPSPYLLEMNYLISALIQEGDEVVRQMLVGEEALPTLSNSHRFWDTHLMVYWRSNEDATVEYRFTRDPLNQPFKTMRLEDFIGTLLKTPPRHSNPKIEALRMEALRFYQQQVLARQMQQLVDRANEVYHRYSNHPPKYQLAELFKEASELRDRVLRLANQYSDIAEREYEYDEQLFGWQGRVEQQYFETLHLALKEEAGPQRQDFGVGRDGKREWREAVKRWDQTVSRVRSGRTRVEAYGIEIEEGKGKFGTIARSQANKIFMVSLYAVGALFPYASILAQSGDQIHELFDAQRHPEREEAVQKSIQGFQMIAQVAREVQVDELYLRAKRSWMDWQSFVSVERAKRILNQKDSPLIRHLDEMLKERSALSLPEIEGLRTVEPMAEEIGLKDPSLSAESASQEVIASLHAPVSAPEAGKGGVSITAPEPARREGPYEPAPDPFGLRRLSPDDRVRLTRLIELYHEQFENWKERTHQDITSGKLREKVQREIKAKRLDKDFPAAEYEARLLSWLNDERMNADRILAATLWAVNPSGDPNDPDLQRFLRRGDIPIFVTDVWGRKSGQIIEGGVSTEGYVYFNLAGMRPEFENLVEVILHEGLHAMTQRRNAEGNLIEGTTQILTRMALLGEDVGIDYYSGAYPAESTVAKVFYEINPDSLMAWCRGDISGDQFIAGLKENYFPNADQDKIAKIAAFLKKPKHQWRTHQFLELIRGEVDPIPTIKGSEETGPRFADLLFQSKMSVDFLVHQLIDSEAARQDILPWLLARMEEHQQRYGHVEAYTMNNILNFIRLVSNEKELKKHLDQLVKGGGITPEVAEAVQVPLDRKGIEEERTRKLRSSDKPKMDKRPYGRGLIGGFGSEVGPSVIDLSKLLGTDPSSAEGPSGTDPLSDGERGEASADKPDPVDLKKPEGAPELNRPNDPQDSEEKKDALSSEGESGFNLTDTKEKEPKLARREEKKPQEEKA
ncbi:MAG: GNAT family N-acetyltransferase, partial [Candidatus Omnitrophica bacterium]|nr:GNAT family N-acetyltransferase [Candidatus Omnitrophota bacterium]